MTRDPGWGGSLGGGLRARLARWFPGGSRDAFVWCAIPVLVVVVVNAGRISYWADVAAHEGHGVRGVFTARYETCSKSDCTWFGSFQAAGDVLHGVSYNQGHANLSVGQQVAALDVGAGRYVYPPGGGTGWWLNPVLVLVAVVALGLWVRWTVTIVRRDRRRGALLGPPPT